MLKTNPEIHQLRKAIESLAERKMISPSDFDYLATAIFQKTKEYISPTTLKRMWGYIKGAETIRHSTLNVLSHFLGYKDWESYLLCLCDEDKTESMFFSQTLIKASELRLGCVLIVTWPPNRHCRFLYQGNERFEVVFAENSKLKAGDTFRCSFFLKGHALYLSDLVQDTNQAVNYVAGSKNGITDIRITG